MTFKVKLVAVLGIAGGRMKRGRGQRYYVGVGGLPELLMIRI